MPPEKQLMTNENVKELYSWMGGVNETLKNLSASGEKMEEQLIQRIENNHKESIETNTEVSKFRLDYTAFKTEIETSVKEKARFWGIVAVAIASLAALLTAANIVIQLVK